MDNLQLERLSRDGYSKPRRNQITTDLLMGVFEGWRMDPTPIDQYEQKGKAILRDKFEGFVADNAPIEFVMLGFPFKSINVRDKVIGNIPDMAEEVTMKNFILFNQKIKDVYAPGVTITVVSDGYIFNDILGVHDKTVEMYNEMSQDVAKNAPIQWYQMNDFYSKKQPLSTIRQKIETQWGITSEKLEADIMTNPDVNFLYRGMIRFMEEEVAIREFPSRNQLSKEAKKIARLAMFRNEAYSNLVRTEFKQYIRLSMHPSINDGTKYSFKLINCKNARHSAWHCAIAKGDDGHLLTIHRKDAEEQGYHLSYNNGKPYFFTKN